MPKESTYFISKMVRSPSVPWAEITDAIIKSTFLIKGKYKYAIINFNKANDENDQWYGELAKYEENAGFEQVDEINKSSITSNVSDKILAKSQFIYWPKMAFIGYLRIFNQIREEDFREIFTYLVLQTTGPSGFGINPYTNEEEFFKRIGSMKAIYKIKATVDPNNPTFSEEWAELDQYIKDRSVRKMNHEEVSDKNGTLNSDLPAIASRKIQRVDSQGRRLVIAFGDKMVLMAVDGYGTATITGHNGKRKIVVKTSDKQESFVESATATIAELAESFTQAIKNILNSRGVNDK